MKRKGVSQWQASEKSKKTARSFPSPSQPALPVTQTGNRCGGSLHGHRPEGLAPTKARKAAERAADIWEQEVKAEYQKEQDAKAQGRAYMLPPGKRHDDFASFVKVDKSPYLMLLIRRFD